MHQRRSTSFLDRTFICLTTMVAFSLVPGPAPAVVIAHGGGRGASRHLILNDLSMVALIMDGQTTAGPFDEEVTDYVDGPDMTLAARAGAVPNNAVTVDRASVLDGIPMTLTVNVYGIANRTAASAQELPGVEVSIWHCDAAGVYSAVASAGTEGQKWLRGRQITDAKGVVTFRTILPGLYVGRMAHYHIRMRQVGPNQTSASVTYAAISQLYIADADVDKYRKTGVYGTTAGSTDGQITYSTSDNIYRGVDPVIARMLTLSLSGDYTTSVTSSISLALIVADLPPDDSSSSSSSTNAALAVVIMIMLSILLMMFRGA